MCGSYDIPLLIEHKVEHKKKKKKKFLLRKILYIIALINAKNNYIGRKCIALAILEKTNWWPAWRHEIILFHSKIMLRIQNF